jgi:hypothetical protein
VFGWISVGHHSDSSELNLAFAFSVPYQSFLASLRNPSSMLLVANDQEGKTGLTTQLYAPESPDLAGAVVSHGRRQVRTAARCPIVGPVMLNSGKPDLG